MGLTIYLRAAAAACLLAATMGHATADTPPAPTARDGQHDFDFNLGTWRTHIRRLIHPQTGDTTSVQVEGTVTVRPVWGGRAQLEEIETNGPSGRWQGATLFLYNPAARQWSQTFFDSAHPGRGSTTIGSFANGRANLYAQDVINGRTVLVRGTWSDIKPDSHSYEEAASPDGGKTWETYFAARLERIAP